VRISHFGADAVAVGAAGLARYRLTRPIIRTTSNGKVAIAPVQNEQPTP
jgi:hypothetical protein